MSKLSKTFACAALAAGVTLALPGVAQAQTRNRVGDAADKTYPPSHYMPPPAAYPPHHCGWVSERYWHKGRWHRRRVWRCR